MTTATLNEQEQEAIATIREKAARQREHQERIDQLERQIGEAQDRLTRAEDFKSFAAQRITQLQSLQLQLCGRERTVANVDPTAQCLDSYQTILVLRSVIADWPRVQRYLSDQVDAAKQQLAEFSKRAPAQA